MNDNEKKKLKNRLDKAYEQTIKVDNFKNELIDLVEKIR